MWCSLGQAQGKQLQVKANVSLPLPHGIHSQFKKTAPVHHTIYLHTYTHHLRAI